MTEPAQQAVLTEVSAVVPAAAQEDLVAGFRELLARPLPDGLLRTELLHDGTDTWRVQSLWHDRAALDAMRAGPEPPAAPVLFRSVGAEPRLTILDVVLTHSPTR